MGKGGWQQNISRTRSTEGAGQLRRRLRRHRSQSGCGAAHQGRQRRKTVTVDHRSWSSATAKAAVCFKAVQDLRRQRRTPQAGPIRAAGRSAAIALANAQPGGLPAKAGRRLNVGIGGESDSEARERPGPASTATEFARLRRVQGGKRAQRERFSKAARPGTASSRPKQARRGRALPIRAPNRQADQTARPAASQRSDPSAWLE